MVDSIQGIGPSFGAFSAPQPLTDDQKTQIQSILSNYDPSKLTADDAKSIFKSLREAGIRPGPGIKETVSSAGFDMEKLRSLADPQSAQGVQGAQGHKHGHHHGGKGSSGNGIDTSALQSLQSILSQYDLSNLSTDQQKDLVSKLDDAGLMQKGYTINLSA